MNNVKYDDKAMWKRGGGGGALKTNEYSWTEKVERDEYRRTSRNGQAEQPRADRAYGVRERILVINIRPTQYLIKCIRKIMTDTMRGSAIYPEEIYHGLSA